MTMSALAEGMEDAGILSISTPVTAPFAHLLKDTRVTCCFSFIPLVSGAILLLSGALLFFARTCVPVGALALHARCINVAVSRGFARGLLLCKSQPAFTSPGNVGVLLLQKEFDTLLGVQL